MAFNEKALRIARRNESPQRSGLDQFDREAEREGNARGWMNRNSVGPAILGRRIAKNSRQADGFAKTAEFKATAHIVKETARIVAERTIRPRQLSQV